MKRELSQRPEEKVPEILEKLDLFHSAYYEAGTFTGPSLHFHLRALDCRNCCDTFAEASYAALVSWGMHRPGPRGSKMKDFDLYKASLNRLWPKIQLAAQFDPLQMDEDKWPLLKHLFENIEVMNSETLLVGNSKVMAHALPHLIPPIDREYTLNYLYENSNIQNDKEKEWEKLKEIVTTFFLPITREELFKEKYEAWSRNQHDFPWDTSPLKVVDNLLIGAMKNKKKGEPDARDNSGQIATDEKALLDREFEEYQANPKAGAEWKEVESRLRQHMNRK